MSPAPLQNQPGAEPIKAEAVREAAADHVNKVSQEARQKEGAAGSQGGSELAQLLTALTRHLQHEAAVPGAGQQPAQGLQAQLSSLVQLLQHQQQQNKDSLPLQQQQHPQPQHLQQQQHPQQHTVGLPHHQQQHLQQQHPQQQMDSLPQQQQHLQQYIDNLHYQQHNDTGASQTAPLPLHPHPHAPSDCDSSSSIIDQFVEQCEEASQGTQQQQSGSVNLLLSGGDLHRTPETGETQQDVGSAHQLDSTRDLARVPWLARPELQLPEREGEQPMPHDVAFIATPKEWRAASGGLLPSPSGSRGSECLNQVRLLLQPIPVASPHAGLAQTLQNTLATPVPHSQHTTQAPESTPSTSMSHSQYAAAPGSTSLPSPLPPAVGEVQQGGMQHIHSAGLHDAAGLNLPGAYVQTSSHSSQRNMQHANSGGVRSGEGSNILGSFVTDSFGPDSNMVTSHVSGRGCDTKHGPTHHTAAATPGSKAHPHTDLTSAPASNASASDHALITLNTTQTTPGSTQLTSPSGSPQVYVHSSAEGEQGSSSKRELPLGGHKMHVGLAGQPWQEREREQWEHEAQEWHLQNEQRHRQQGQQHGALEQWEHGDLQQGQGQQHNLRQASSSVRQSCGTQTLDMRNRGTQTHRNHSSSCRSTAGSVGGGLEDQHSNSSSLSHSCGTSQAGSTRGPSSVTTPSALPSHESPSRLERKHELPRADHPVALSRTQRALQNLLQQRQQQSSSQHGTQEVQSLGMQQRGPHNNSGAPADLHIGSDASSCQSNSQAQYSSSTWTSSHPPRQRRHQQFAMDHEQPTLGPRQEHPNRPTVAEHQHPTSAPRLKPSASDNGNRELVPRRPASVPTVAQPACILVLANSLGGSDADSCASSMQGPVDEELRVVLSACMEVHRLRNAVHHIHQWQQRQQRKEHLQHWQQQQQQRQKAEQELLGQQGLQRQQHGVDMGLLEIQNGATQAKQQLQSLHAQAIQGLVFKLWHFRAQAKGMKRAEAVELKAANQEPAISCVSTAQATSERPASTTPLASLSPSAAFSRSCTATRKPAAPSPAAAAPASSAPPPAHSKDTPRRKPATPALDSITSHDSNSSSSLYSATPSVRSSKHHHHLARVTDITLQTQPRPQPRPSVSQKMQAHPQLQPLPTSQPRVQHRSQLERQPGTQPQDQPQWPCSQPLQTQQPHGRPVEPQAQQLLSNEHLCPQLQPAQAPLNQQQGLACNQHVNPVIKPPGSAASWRLLEEQLQQQLMGADAGVPAPPSLGQLLDQEGRLDLFRAQDQDCRGSNQFSVCRSKQQLGEQQRLPEEEHQARLRKLQHKEQAQQQQQEEQLRLHEAAKHELLLRQRDQNRKQQQTWELLRQKDNQGKLQQGERQPQEEQLFRQQEQLQQVQAQLQRLLQQKEQQQREHEELECLLQQEQEQQEQLRLIKEQQSQKQQQQQQRQLEEQERHQQEQLLEQQHRKQQQQQRHQQEQLLEQQQKQRQKEQQQQQRQRGMPFNPVDEQLHQQRQQMLAARQHRLLKQEKAACKEAALLEYLQFSQQEVLLPRPQAQPQHHKAGTKVVKTKLPQQQQQQQQPRKVDMPKRPRALLVEEEGTPPIVLSDSGSDGSLDQSWQSSSKASCVSFGGSSSVGQMQRKARELQQQQRTHGLKLGSPPSLHTAN